MDLARQRRGSTWAVGYSSTRTIYAYIPLILLCLTPHGSTAKEFVDKFDLCNTNLGPVFNDSGTYMNMNKAAMQERGYIYDDWPRELPQDTTYPREKYITLTYKGSLITCLV